MKKSEEDLRGMKRKQTGMKRNKEENKENWRETKGAKGRKVNKDVRRGIKRNGEEEIRMKRNKDDKEV